MVKKHFFCILLSCIVGLPMLVQARTISSITIKFTGRDLSLKPDHDLSPECIKFNPTVEQIKQFFTKAHPVGGYMHGEERYTPCYASGQIEFSDNKSAEWGLYSSGIGIVTFSKNNQVLLFYQDYEWYDPTACTYGMGDEDEC